MERCDVVTLPAYEALSATLQRLIDGYETDPRILPAQRARWHPEGARPALARGMWGRDHPKALVLLEFDREPVGSVSATTAAKYWDIGHGHVCPKTEDLVRTGLFFHRDLYETLALALKGEWERCLARRSGWKSSQRTPFSSVLRAETMWDLQVAFDPDLEAVFGLVERYGAMASSEGYTLRTFGAMANEMLKRRLQYGPVESPEIREFAREQHEQTSLLRTGSAREQDEFWLLYRSWQERLSRLDEVLIACESLRVRIAETDRQWLAVFGDVEVRLREQALRCEEMRERIRRKRANRRLTRDDLDKAMRERVTADALELEDLGHRVALSPLWAKRFHDGTVTSPEEIHEYQKACKSVVRRIFHLTFSDRLEQHPRYRQLTDRQKANLRAAFDRARAAKPDDVGWDDRDLRSGVRSLEGLLQVLGEVEHDLEFAGIDVDYRLTMQGATLAERMEWLGNQSVRATQETSAAQSELSILRQRLESESAQKAAILASRDRHPGVRADILKEVEAFRWIGDGLVAQLDQLFNEGGPA